MITFAATPTGLSAVGDPAAAGFLLASAAIYAGDPRPIPAPDVTAPDDLLDADPLLRLEVDSMASELLTRAQARRALHGSRAEQVIARWAASATTAVFIDELTLDEVDHLAQWATDLCYQIQVRVLPTRPTSMLFPETATAADLAEHAAWCTTNAADLQALQLFTHLAQLAHQRLLENTDT